MAQVAAGETSGAGPARVSDPDKLRSESSAVSFIADGVRACGENVSDSEDALAAEGAPESWSGDASVAANNAFTTLSGKLDRAFAALTTAVTALDTFDDAVQALKFRREDLTEEVSTHNGKIDAYDADVVASRKDDQVAQDALIARSETLAAAATALRAKVDQWNTDQTRAEQKVIAALQSVDTVIEASVTANSPDRPDPQRLADELRRRAAAGDPEAVAAWWKGLSNAEITALTMHSPELVGNTGGVPAAVRDEANRASVRSDIDYLRNREADGELTESEREKLRNARSAQETLDAYADEINKETGELEALLLAYRPDAFGGDGGVAMSLGNPDTADNVVSLVPGLTSDATSLLGNMDTLEALRKEADDRNGDESVAGIVWIDYNAPGDTDAPGSLFPNPLDPMSLANNTLDWASVAGPAAARAGGERFADFVEGLRASDSRPANADADWTAIGHSYGSTTVAYSRTAGDADIDTMVLLASPGAADAANATDLMPNGELYVGSADRDFVSLLGDPGVGSLGKDPAQDSFDAHRFAVDPGSNSVKDLINNHNLGTYLNTESSSFDAVADIVAGQGPDEVAGRVPGNYQTLPEMVGGMAAQDAYDATEPVRSGAEWLYERGRDVGEWTYDRGRDAGEWAGDRARDAGEWTYERGRDAGEWAGDRARDAGEWTYERGRDAGEWTGDRARDAGEWTGDRARDAGEWTGDRIDDVRDGFDKIPDWVWETRGPIRLW